MALIAYYLILFLTASFAIATGGRFERLIGGLMIFSSLLGTTCQRLFHNYFPLAANTTIDSALLAALIWIAWRYRRPWVLLIVLAQASVLFFDLGQLTVELLPRLLYANLQNSQAYLQLLALALGALWRVYGPPAEPPETPGETPDP